MNILPKSSQTRKKPPPPPPPPPLFGEKIDVSNLTESIQISFGIYVLPATTRKKETNRGREMCPRDVISI